MNVYVVCAQYPVDVFRLLSAHAAEEEAVAAAQKPPGSPVSVWVEEMPLLGKIGGQIEVRRQGKPALETFPTPPQPFAMPPYVPPAQPRYGPDGSEYISIPGQPTPSNRVPPYVPQATRPCGVCSTPISATAPTNYCRACEQMLQLTAKWPNQPNGGEAPPTPNAENM